MIFVDTNYFLRFLLNDNHAQHSTAVQLFRDGANGIVQLATSVIVLFEIYWVLSSFYQQQPAELVRLLQNILDMEFITVPEREILRNALVLFSVTSPDLEDCYHIAYARSINANEFKTFDKKLHKLFAG